MFSDWFFYSNDFGLRLINTTITFIATTTSLNIIPNAAATTTASVAAITDTITDILFSP